MHISSENVTFDDTKFQVKFNDQRLLAKHDDCKIHLKDINQQELEYLFNLLLRLKVNATVIINNIEFYIICLVYYPTGS